MELELTRVDYTIVGTTNSNCLELIAGNSSIKEAQLIAVGDTGGILQVFSIGKDDIALHFKTLPGPQITSIKISGTPGTPNDKIFMAFGSEVRGYTKKGKQFLNFNSGLTEPIKAMYVLGMELFLCGEHIYTHYRDCKELGSYICGDKIVDVLAFYSVNKKRLLSLIACEGRMIRTLEHARVTSSIETESSPTVLHIYEGENDKSILFGTVDGRIGILDVEDLQIFKKWLLISEHQSPISCIDSYALNGNTTKNLVVGGQNGTIDVYQINISDELDLPKPIFKYNCNETITSLKCGLIGSSEYEGIVVATYTGRIFGLTTQTVGDEVQSSGASISSLNNSQIITKLKGDIEDLKSKIIKERDRYQSSGISYLNEVSTIPLVMVKGSFILNKNMAIYNLNIDLSTPVDNILLQCDRKIDIVEVAKNSAAVSYSECDDKNGNGLLVTYRCQINTNGLELKVNVAEGNKAKLLAYATPLLQPKCCRVMTYDIKPLCLHYRIYHFDESRPYNVLSMTGTFSLAEINFWLAQCLPEVPDKPQISEDTELWFESSLLGTMLQCRYKKGEAEFKSDNVSTISIMKTNLTQEATKKRNKISINTKINEESIGYVIRSQEDVIRSSQENLKKTQLREAIQELEIDEGSIELLPTKYKTLLSEKLEKISDIDKLYSAIIELYMDYHKLKGTNVKQKASKLMPLLEQYDSNEIIAFFKPD